MVSSRPHCRLRPRSTPRAHFLTGRRHRRHITCRKPATSRPFARSPRPQAGGRGPADRISERHSLAPNLEQPPRAGLRARAGQPGPSQSATPGTTRPRARRPGPRPTRRRALGGGRERHRYARRGNLGLVEASPRRQSAQPWGILHQLGRRDACRAWRQGDADRGSANRRRRGSFCKHAGRCAATPHHVVMARKRLRKPPVPLVPRDKKPTRSTMLSTTTSRKRPGSALCCRRRRTAEKIRTPRRRAGPR